VTALELHHTRRILREEIANARAQNAISSAVLDEIELVLDFRRLPPAWYSSSVTSMGCVEFSAWRLRKAGGVDVVQLAREAALSTERARLDSVKRIVKF
jgi:hypothetical protein